MGVAERFRPFGSQCLIVWVFLPPPPITGPSRWTGRPSAAAFSIAIPTITLGDGSTILMEFSIGWPGV
ncbi:hypothetical protein [Methanogenium cariaci]|uniref:hypothetical protein n=1 Tax=Methanogenium cariaci TaxID=2197 RepID=UPI001FDED79C|nr:hypothetical protein [Methanogenium cariaci]